MKLNDLIAKFRDESDDDIAESYTWEDEAVVELLNDAVEEACRRKSLIFDKSTAEICSLAITAGTDVYLFDESVDYITKAYLVDSDGVIMSYLYLTDRDNLDQIFTYWRESDADTPAYMVVDDTSLQLIPIPSADCTLRLEVFRVPTDTEKLSVSNMTNGPVIGATHHKFLHHWALSVAYNKRNMQKYDPKRSEYHLQKFEEYFGGPVEAKRIRDSRTSIPQHNQVYP